MLNANDIINYLRLNPNNINYVISQLWIEFYNLMATKDGIILGCPHRFVDSVNKILKVMDLIFNSFKDDKANLIWVSVFNKIRMVGLNYYIFIIDEKFLNLEFRYSKSKLNIVEAQNEALKFFGLRQGFTKEEFNKVYRKYCLIYHPDKGGNKDNFLKLQVYREQLERSFC
jgi:hypothetical protein